MFVKNFIQSGNILQGEFGVELDGNRHHHGVKFSPEYTMRRSVFVQFKSIGAKAHYKDNTFVDHDYIYNYIYVRFTKVRENDDNYTLKLTSKKLGSTDNTFISNGVWNLLHENTATVDYHTSFDAKITIVDTPTTKPSFASLHEETEMTDFELRGEGGSVHVHKAVLASSSPVFQRMLTGSWKESTEGAVDVPGTTLASLQHFKDYIYMDSLPSMRTELDHLLILSGYYMMPDLERRCKDIIMKSLTSQDACEYLKLAGKHNLNILMVEILDNVRFGNVNVDDIRDYLFPSKLQGG